MKARSPSRKADDSTGDVWSANAGRNPVEHVFSFDFVTAKGDSYEVFTGSAALIAHGRFRN